MRKQRRLFLLSIDVKGDKSAHQRQMNASTAVTVDPVSFPASIQSFLEHDWTCEDCSINAFAPADEKRDA